VAANPKVAVLGVLGVLGGMVVDVAVSFR